MGTESHQRETEDYGEEQRKAETVCGTPNPRHVVPVLPCQPEHGVIYSIVDLAKLEWLGDDEIEVFRRNWDNRGLLLATPYIKEHDGGDPIRLSYQKHGS